MKKTLFLSYKDAIYSLNKETLNREGFRGESFTQIVESSVF